MKVVQQASTEELICFLILTPLSQFLLYFFLQGQLEESLKFIPNASLQHKLGKGGLSVLQLLSDPGLLT